MALMIRSCVPYLTPTTTVLEAIAQMSQKQIGCVLVVEQGQLVGVFTERDLVRAIAAGTELQDAAIETVMNRSIIALKESEVEAIAKDLSTVQDLFQQQQVQYLPVIDAEGGAIGVITLESLLQESLKHQAIRRTEVSTASDRLPIETVLQEKQEQLRLAVDLTHIGTWDWDAATNRLVWNENSARLFDHPLDQLATQPQIWLARLHPEDRDRVLQIEAAALANHTDYEVEYRIIWLDGSVRWIFARGCGIYSKSGQLVRMIGCMIDATDRKQAEETLRQREEQLRLALDFTQIGMWDWHLSTDRVIRNENTARLLGQPLDQLEVTAQHWEDCVHPEDRDRVWQITANALKNCITAEVEYRIIQPDGTIRWVLGRGRGVYDESGQAARMIGCVMDITDRKLAEQALRESEQRFRAVFEQASVGIIKSSLSGQFFQVNQRFCEIVGYTEAELRSQNFQDITAPEDLGLDLEFSRRLLAGEISVFSIEKRYVCKDAQLRWVNLTGSLVCNDSGIPQYFLGVVEDIQERKQAEAVLQESQRFIQRIADASPNIIYVYDLMEWRCIYANRSLATLLGYSSAEIRVFDQACIQRLMQPDDWVALTKFIQQLAASNNQETFEFEYRMRRKDGQWCWLLGHSTVFTWTPDRQPQQVLGMITDITERKQGEEALQKAKADAEAASLAKSEFLSRMSHELRTPLTAILGFTELLSGDSSLRRETLENLAIISRSGEHLLNLINNILEMSKIEAGEIRLNQTSVDLYYLLNSIEELLRLQAASKGLDLIFEWAIANPHSQFIKTDENKLRQVLINLLGNAIKFTHTGRISLRISSGDSGGDGSATELASAPSTLHFEVKDTGPGIAPEEIPTLFDAFFQTNTGRRSQDGTGLGLAISQKFVQLMGGTITVESQVGQGTTFTFDIPFKLAETGPARPSSIMRQHQISLALGQHNYRILLVDDEPLTRKILLKLLAPLGFEILEAVDGEEAIAAWEQWHPHLIWMDMQMPSVSGYEVTQLIREREARNQEASQPETREQEQSVSTSQSSQTKPHETLSKTIIIALTASAFQDQQVKAIAAGCDDFVTKPFQQTIILEKMAEYLDLDTIYADQEPLSTTHSLPKAPAEEYLLTAASLTIMPAEWIAALNTAASRLSSSRCLDLIEQIPEENIVLVDILRTWVESFRFDTILEVTQKAVN